MATTVQRPDSPLAAREAEPRPRGDRFVATGLFLLAALFVAVQLLAGTVIPPLAVPAVLYALLGAAVLRWHPRWLLAAVAVLMLVHVVSSLPFLAEALAHPETPATFVPDALIVVVAFVVIVGAVLGLRRGGAARRRPVAVVGAVAAVGVITLSALSAAGVASDARQDGDVPVPAAQAQFPERVEVAAGGAVLWVDNQDAFRHTLVVEGTDLHAELPGSTAVRVDTDLAPGTYRYFCDVPGHDGMEGELVAR